MMSKRVRDGKSNRVIADTPNGISFSGPFQSVDLGILVAHPNLEGWFKVGSPFRECGPESDFRGDGIAMLTVHFLFPWKF